MFKKILLAGVAAASLAALTAQGAMATVWSGTLYYTYYAGTPNIADVTYSYDDATQTFLVGTPTPLATTPGADGIIFAPNGNLLIGGQGFGVYEVNPTTGAIVGSAKPGSPGQNLSSYHLTLDPSGTKFYTSDFGGPLDTVPLPLAQGTTMPVTGDDNGLTQIAFGDSGMVFYVNGQPNGFGNLGTIDLSTGVTTRLYSGVTPAHGLIYDPYSDLITMFGDGYVGTMNATDGSNLKTGGSFACDFDQGAVDGHGHALVAGCNAITFIDYSVSGDITNPDYYTSVGGFNYIDDVAPLVGAGANPNPPSVPEPATLFLLGGGLAGLRLMKRRRRKA